MKPEKVIKKTQADLHELQFKIFDLPKEYARVVEFTYSILQVAFENALKHVEFFHI